MNKSHQKRATVQDVAVIAKVSVATVSRALAKPDKVSTNTRLIVLEAVRKTGYTVNEAARNLRSQKTSTIVIFIPDIGNPFFSNIVEGIVKVFTSNNINVLISDTHKASIFPTNALTYFSHNKVDGIIILDGLMPLESLSSTQSSPPIVFAGEWQDGTDLPVVKIDDIFGSKLAVEHLYNLGHRRFGHVTGSLNNLPGKNRLKGFIQALNNLGCDSSDTWQFEADFLLASGRRAAHDWFALPISERPTGIFCAGDEMAFSFMSTLTKLGINVPKDVSVVGYDDLLVAEYFVPALTTIHQPRRALGALAAETLLSLIERPGYTRPKPIKPYLVTRDSTAPPINHFHG